MSVATDQPPVPTATEASAPGPRPGVPAGAAVTLDNVTVEYGKNRALADVYKKGGIDAIYQRWLAPLGPPGPLLNAMYYLNAIPD